MATSAVTLAVAAAITLGPLQSRLRDESATALQERHRGHALGLQHRARARPAKPSASATRTTTREAGRRRGAARARDAGRRRLRPARAHRRRARARHRPRRSPTADGEAPGVPLRHRLRRRRRRERARARAPGAARRATPETQIIDDELTLRDAALRRTARSPASSSPQRSLTEVATTVRLVRNALFTAAAIGLAVAIGARARALEHAHAPARAPAARGAADHRRGPGGARADRPRPRRGRRPRPRARPHAGGAAPPGGGAALVRRHRLARAAHAADDAPGHDGAARRGPARRRRPRPTPRSRSRAPAASCGGSSVLATELLDLSRLDADVQLRSEPVELGEIARAVAAEFSLRAGDRDVELEVDSAGPVLGARRPGGLRAGRADPDRQRAALRAARASRSRSAPTHVGARVAVRVADHGPGVPAGRARAHLRALPPRQGDERRERLRPRAGDRPRAGRADGRHARARRTPTRGACFVLTLPASASSPSPSPAPDSAAAA